mmetsp:Transcript_12449/g.29629  ORF Transcript_12449/g.29629 Transcript_12449/m.29629 type:complete len:100 (-) Transcript_12449:1021-1320(-)
MLQSEITSDSSVPAIHTKSTLRCRTEVRCTLRRLQLHEPLLLRRKRARSQGRGVLIWLNAFRTQAWVNTSTFKLQVLEFVPDNHRYLIVILAIVSSHPD